jgi:AraC-like DNA-binding protein
LRRSSFLPLLAFIDRPSGPSLILIHIKFRLLHQMYLLALIIFAAAVQGILLSYFLLRRRGRSLQHRSLAALVITIALVLLGAIIGLSGLYREWPHVIRYSDPLVLVIGPLLYFHVHAATRGKLPPFAWLHFLPVVLYLIYIAPFYMLSGAEKIAKVEQAMSTRLSSGLTMLLTIRMSLMLGYSVLSLVLLRRFQRGLQDLYSNVEERDLHRSAQFLAGYIAITIGSSIIIAASIYMQVSLVVANAIFSLLLAACVYGLSYASWPHANEPAITPITPSAPVSPRPQRSIHHLSEDQFKVISSKMIAALELDKAYLDGDLTIAQLSERMTVPAYQVSEAISRHYRSNFFDAVNRLRVEEVKRRLTDPEHSVYSIVGIAMDSGFNSKSSFNAAFKKYTGTTPSQFRLN